MAYGSGAWQNDPRVANKENDDKNGFDRMMQLAAVASMMDNKTALGFGLGNLIASYLAKQRAAKADALAARQQATAEDQAANAGQLAVLGQNGSQSGSPISAGMAPQQAATLGSAGMTPGKSYALGLEPYTRTAWQDTPTSAEVQQAAASVFGQTPQGTAGATVSAPTTLTLVNPAGAQQFQWPSVNTDWLHRNS